MNKFTPHINVEYPKNNFKIFEEWFAENYKGCNTDMELMPFFPTSYFVNNGYNENEQANKEAQDYVDSLDINKKWFVLCQYDNGCIVDWNGKDVLEFNMSVDKGVEMPLLCQPHPYKYDGSKKYLASFIGSRTHPIRNELEKFSSLEDFYISFEPHPIEKYCEIISQSVFSLCPRGFGANSFRTSESLQYGAIPVYISDKFIFPYSRNWAVNVPDYMLLINQFQIDGLPKQLREMNDEQIISLMDKGAKAYQEYYTYEGAMKQIIRILESENAPKS